jgi:uncharacterized protein (DUF433 family)
MGEVSKLPRRIVSDPGICDGKPRFDGTRIPVYMVLDLLSDGMSAEQIRTDCYPHLSDDDIREALRFASELAKRGRATKG